MPLLAIALGVFASSFNLKENNVKTLTGEIYWVFNGSAGQEGNAALYAEVPGNHVTCAGSSANLCNIFAPRDPLHTSQPDLGKEVVADRTFKP